MDTWRGMKNLKRKKNTHTHKIRLHRESEWMRSSASNNTINLTILQTIVFLCFRIISFTAKLLVIIDSCLPQSFGSMLVSFVEFRAHTERLIQQKKMHSLFFDNARALHTQCKHELKRMRTKKKVQSIMGSTVVMVMVLAPRTMYETLLRNYCWHSRNEFMEARQTDLRVKHVVVERFTRIKVYVLLK